MRGGRWVGDVEGRGAGCLASAEMVIGHWEQVAGR